MTDKKYQGWTNWETWNVVLWFDNDEKLYDMKIKHLKFVIQRNIKTDRFGTELSGKTLKTRCKDFLKQRFNETKTPDNPDLSKVDWEQIAAKWNEELLELANND